MSLAKYTIIAILSLPLSLIFSSFSVVYQTEKLVEACLQPQYCPGEYVAVNFGGFPIQFTGRADINSPANVATFEDGWDAGLFIANTATYFVILLPIFAYIHKKFFISKDPKS